MMPFSLSRNAKIALATGTLLVLLLGLLLLQNNNASNDNGAQAQNSETNSPMLSIEDIENIFVHSGLDIPCPDIEGVAGHGYVYSVQLTQERGIIERVGCGIGTPEVYAQAIASDLEARGAFAPLDIDLVLQKLSFKFYEVNNNQE